MSSEIATDRLTIDGHAVPTVFEPETVEDLTRFLGDAPPDASYVLTAGRTRLAFGNVGGPYDGAISLRRLNRVISYEPDDMTIAVEPGCTIAQIHELLHASNQDMALDVAHPERATIGGSFATGLSSPRRLAGGSLKDWAIGIEVVGPDGTRAKAGGMVVKNVTGFDMMHVHFGALGAFGIVTRLNLKVFPRMSSARSIALHYAAADDAHAAGEALLRSQLQPTSLLLTNGNGGWTLHVRCDAPTSAIERVVERVVEVASIAAPPDDTTVDHNPNAALAPFTDVVDLTTGRAVARLPITASRQLAALRQLADADGVAICADMGSGLVYAAGQPDEAWLRRLESLHPSPTCLALLEAMKREMDVFGHVDVAAEEVVRNLKDAFDPDRRFNRGRFVAHL